MNYFDNGLGKVTDSLAYYRNHRHDLGAIIAAEVAFPGVSEHYPYCLELRDDHGNRMFLSGLTAGYPGDGPRAAMEVLIDAGFTADDAQRVYHERQLTLRQPARAPDPEPAALKTSRADRPDPRRVHTR